MIAAFAIIGVLGALVVLFILGRYNETSLVVDWAEVVSPAGRRAYEDLRARFASERAALDLTCDRAAESRRTEEAAQLLAAGYSFLEHVVVERRLLLENMARYSRMVGAIAPVPPLRPGDFHLRQLVTLAGVGAIVHHLVVTMPERLRLRVLILRTGLGVVLRAYARGTRRRDPDWKLVATARADWNTLNAETLDSFRALVTSVVLPSEAAARLAAGR
jgi:hypothetical protein